MSEWGGCHICPQSVALALTKSFLPCTCFIDTYNSHLLIKLKRSWPVPCILVPVHKYILYSNKLIHLIPGGTENLHWVIYHESDHVSQVFLKVCGPI